MKIEKNSGHYDVINWLKGFSILTIVLMHLMQFMNLPSMISKAASLGGTGVHVFFFCSGFGLYLSQYRNPLHYSTFIKKRFWKVYIPYVFIVCLIAMIPFSFVGDISERWIALLSHIFLFKMFVPSLEESFAYSLWYMSTIFQFYFLFIPLCGLKRKVGNKPFLILCCSCSVIWWIFTALTGIATERIWGSFFLQYLWEFAIGMYIAEYLEQGGKIVVKYSRILFIILVGLLLGGFLGYKGGIYKAFNDCFIASGYLFLALLVFDVMPFTKRIFRAISSVSYEWYLVHVTCFLCVFEIAKYWRISEMIVAILSFFISILVAIIFHGVFDKWIYNKRAV